MNVHLHDPVADALRELPEGMLEYELRCALRNLRLVSGFEAMRETAARMINDEAEGSRKNGNR